jgi:VanZ family protein
MNAGMSRPAARPGVRADRITRAEVIRYWGVVAAWMAVIFAFSGEPFSARNTNLYLDPILRFFFPDLTPSGFVLAHSVIRKTAHFVEFFILGCLGFWASRRGRQPRWRATWMLQAVGLAASYALLDEAHQALVPGRTASLIDSGVDVLGALASQGLIYVWHGWRAGDEHGRV